MLKRVIFAGCIAMLCGTAQAEPEHAIAPEGAVLPVVTREICTTMLWGSDEIRSDCRTETRAAPKDNPALKGICTIYYGRRTCH
ncbi:MAG: hypothetical protein MUO37_08820 [Methyloceanibacter sp.]|jgi:hypothetical protein|nr:hypothetical protein [Methyloceanibacter sp.]